MLDLQGKVCLLTGASRGIGHSLALRLAREGMHLALVARAADPLEALAAEITRAGGTARAFPADLARTSALAPLVQAVEAELGPVAALVNNAGVETFQHYDAAEVDGISQAVRINVDAPLVLTRLVLPGMLQRGQGQVVFLASTAGLLGTPYGAVYSATKAALIAASSSLRMEYADRGVGFSAICPGFAHGAGMHEVHKVEVGPAPALLGGTTVDAVVDAVVHALRYDPAEVIVNSSPLRPLVGLGRALPAFAGWATRLLSGRYMKAIADARASSGSDRF